MPHIYIIYSKKLDKYCVGACIDLQRSLYEHNIRHSKFTSLGLPWIYKYSQSFATLSLAKKRELEIIKKKSRNYIKKLIGKSIG